MQSLVAVAAHITNVLRLWATIPTECTISVPPWDFVPKWAGAPSDFWSHATSRSSLGCVRTVAKNRYGPLRPLSSTILHGAHLAPCNREQLVKCRHPSYTSNWSFFCCYAQSNPPIYKRKRKLLDIHACAFMGHFNHSHQQIISDHVCRASQVTFRYDKTVWPCVILPGDGIRLAIEKNDMHIAFIVRQLDLPLRLSFQSSTSPCPFPLKRIRVSTNPARSRKILRERKKDSRHKQEIYCFDWGLVIENMDMHGVLCL